jgi:translation initiation factor 2-alpha kinase 4
MAALEDISQSGGGDWANLSLEIQSELTTKIGTALYVSPELCPTPKPATVQTPNAGTSKIAYTQKVDIYSLGIVFFEMFYRPLKTGMERIKLLSDLRRPEIILPADFVNLPANEKPVKIVQALLQHDADRRPTADELLHSDLLPAVEMQPSEFQLIVKQTLSNTQTHQYKWLINALLDDQFPSSVQEYVYDADMYDLVSGTRTRERTFGKVVFTF